MNFTFETQGAITYLVCELSPTEQLDTLTLGMLSNNNITGAAPVLYTEMNGQRFLKYNISAKLTLTQFFEGTVNKQRALTAFKNVLNSVCNADDYMIEQSNFLFEPDKIFINVSNCEVAMICVPVVTQKSATDEIIKLFTYLLEITQFDSSENTSYVTELKNFISNSAGFNIYSFKDFVDNLSMSVAQSTYQQPEPIPAGGPIPTAMAFNDTISIDDMPNTPSMPQQPIMPQQPVQQMYQQPAQPIYQQPIQQPPVVQQPNTMPTPVRPIVNTPPMPMAQQPMAGQVPVQTPPAVKPDKKSKKKKNKSKQGGLDVAIPGQTAKPQAVQIPGVDNQSAQSQSNQEEKKMSFFDLMAHYNKENAAIYKAQKESKKTAEHKEPKPKKEKKAKKNKQQPIMQQPPVQAQPMQNPVNRVQPTMPSQQLPYGQAPMGAQQPVIQQAPVQQQIPVVQPQTPLNTVQQPIPVQNSFNETTVLSNINMGGETTVLNMTPEVVEPYLVRVKTGEKVFVNKPVFRIGKEKSYVDYFIADNTAISRSHCNIHTENGEYYIEDTNSTNHTFINGKIINSNVKTKIVSGDRIRLANEEFTFTV